MDELPPSSPRSASDVARQALAWLAAVGSPRAQAATRTATHVGRWSVRAFQWRQTAHRTVASARLASNRAQAALGIFFAVVPATPKGEEEEQAEQKRVEAEWKPSVPAQARIIVNPNSGSVRGNSGLKELRETAMWLTEQGLPTELTLTKNADHASILAREAVAAGLQTVIAAGGDGTVNDVIQSLAGTTTALAVLPLGTVNVWARETGIPFSSTEAREILLNGVRRRIDVGRAGRRYFLMMAGIGFDAEVVKRVEKNWLTRIGLKMVDYLATAGALGLTQQPARLQVRSNGQKRASHALMVIVGNTRLYGGAFTFTQKALADDGWLDVVVIGGHSLADRMTVAIRAVTRRPNLGPKVRYSRSRSVHLSSSPPLPVQVDGEIIGHLPMTFTIVPSALTVILPPNTPQDIFSRPPW